MIIVEQEFPKLKACLLAAQSVDRCRPPIDKQLHCSKQFYTELQLEMVEQGYPSGLSEVFGMRIVVDE